MAQEAVYRATEGDSTLQDLLRTVGVSVSFRAKSHCHDPVDLLLTMGRHEVFQEQVSALHFVIFHRWSHQLSMNVHVLHIQGSFQMTRWRRYYELVWYFVRIHHVHFLAREQYKTVSLGQSWTRQIPGRASFRSMSTSSSCGAVASWLVRSTLDFRGS